MFRQQRFKLPTPPKTLTNTDSVASVSRSHVQSPGSETQNKTKFSDAFAISISYYTAVNLLNQSANSQHWQPYRLVTKPWQFYPLAAIHQSIKQEIRRKELLDSSECGNLTATEFSIKGRDNFKGPKDRFLT